MTKKFTSEILLAVLLSALIISLLDPWMLWMPGEVLMSVLFLAVAVFSVYTAFVWRESAQDEREEYHRLLAGRIAWLVGTTVLMIGLFVQGLAHEIDPWLAYALLAMIIAKVAARAYTRIRK